MIGFAGLSHLGIVSSVAAAAKGFEVVAYDPDPVLCEALRAGRLPVVEPGLAALLSDSASRITFTAEASRLGTCDVIYVSVDVPTDEDGRSDLTAIEGIIDRVAAAGMPGAVLVFLSQVPPGFTRAIAERLKRLHRDCAFRVFYQVETLILGTAVERALQPERFIVGCDGADTALPVPYAALLGAFNCPILPMRYESAELAKISINMFLVSSVSTTNTIAELCEAIGADWSEIAPALRLDRRIGPHAYLSPGLGIAGGNLERDLATIRVLAAEFGTDAGIVDAWLSSSRHRREWVLRTLHAEVIARAEAPTIAVWGLSYKPNTASTKNSPAFGLLDALRSVPVRAYDPEVVLAREAFPRCVQVGSALDAVRGADALAIMTAWPEFSTADLCQVRDAMRGRVLIDPFEAADRTRAAALGFAYFRLGVPACPPVPVPC